MYSLNSSMTILPLTLWFLSWESTARLTSGLHGTRFYSLLLILIPYPLPFLRVNITFLSFLFILSQPSSSLSLSLSHLLSVFLFQGEREVKMRRLEFSFLGRCSLGKGSWRLCLPCWRVNIPSLCSADERRETALNKAGRNYPHRETEEEGDFRIVRILHD
jgi:hypothetical protein